MSTDAKKLAVSVTEACSILSLGRSTLLSLAYSGEIETAKIGRRLLFPVDGLERWLTEQTEKTVKSRA